MTIQFVQLYINHLIDQSDGTHTLPDLERIKITIEGYLDWLAERDSEDFEKEVERYMTFKLPGQPFQAHMGTTQLINRMLLEIKRLQQLVDFPFVNQVMTTRGVMSTQDLGKYLNLVSRVLPGSVEKLIAENPDEQVYLGEELINQVKPKEEE